MLILNGLTKEFYGNFWNEIKCFSEVTKVNQRKRSIKYLPTSSFHYVYRKKDKRYIKNWRPISLLNVDTKIISKVIDAKLKKLFRQ